MKKDYITASEIGDFVYCQRSWWLKRNGLIGPNPAMLKGTLRHSLLHFQLKTWKRKLVLAIILLSIGIILLGIKLFVP